MTKRIPTLMLLGVLAAVGPAHAYFEIDLATGGTVFADSYTEKGEKLLLYRPSGALEVDRGAVKEIRERSGRLTETSTPEQPEAPAAAPPAAAPEKRAVESADSVVIPEGADPAVVEQALTRKLILSHRDLLFARNAGEKEDSIKQRQKEIDQLQKDREAIRKRLGL